MNTYTTKKENIQNNASKLLENYKLLLDDTMIIGSNISHMFDGNAANSNEIMDWVKFSSTDKDMQKISRLMVALMYVEYPQDREIVNALQENIALNSIVDNNSKSRQ